VPTNQGEEEEKKKKGIWGFSDILPYPEGRVGGL
jgi:hypothetical protein